jgi:hypothetical protein
MARNSSRERVPATWFSRRSFILHLSLLLWFPGCLVAFYWQVHRAFDGNALSYLYSIEWPGFAIAGVYVWWVLLHSEPALEKKVVKEKQLEESPPRRVEDEDPELAAYNERLARLSKEGPRTWRKR